MSYFKWDGMALQEARRISTPTVTLDLDSHTEHNYPIMGWRWFEDIEAARAFYGLPTPEEELPEQSAEELEHARRITGIKAEAQRRIIVVTGAPSLELCVIKQLNALMRATELTKKGQENWTPTEAIEAARLQTLADEIKRLRAVSDQLELDPPEDFGSDAYWTP